MESAEKLEIFQFFNENFRHNVNYFFLVNIHLQIKLHVLTPREEFADLLF